MRDSATWLWARSILRRNARATIFLALFAALAGAASMTAWEYSRRAGSVIDRRLQVVQPADGTLNTCPPGEDPGVDITPCLAPEPNQFAFTVLKGSPHIVAESLAVSGQLEVSATEDGPVVATLSASTVEQVADVGSPVIVRGRRFDDDAADEVLLTETVAHRLGVGAGSSVWVAGCPFDFGQGNTECGEPAQVRVTGIIRGDRDLLPARRSPPGTTEAQDVDFGLFAGSRWFTAFGKQYVGFSQTTFRLAPGASLDDVRADMEARLPDGWTVLVSLTEDHITFDGLRQSTALQEGALFAIAVILGLAGAVFVAQALNRQVRRELADHRIASALGMTRRDLAVTALARAVPVAVAGAAIAVAVAAVASGFGPPNLAGRAEVDPGVRIDAFVLAAGGSVLAAFVLVVCVFSATRPVGRRQAGIGRGSGAFSSRMSAAASAGLALGRGSRSGGAGGRTAVLAATAAIVGVITAATLADGLDTVTADPREFGASWQYSFGDFVGDESVDAVTAQTLADPLLIDVTYVYSSGPVRLPSVPAFWVLSFASVKGDLGPVIVEGRAPTADDEVAVGVATLDDLGKGVGDVIESIPVLASGGAAAESTSGTIGPLRIVGVALISDNSRSVGPGTGMVLTEATRRKVDPAASPVILVRTDPAVPPVDTVHRLEQTYGQVTVPSPQSDLSNLTLISSTPWVIAILIAVLAAGALAHAMIGVVRRSRRDIGVLRALGFTGGQVSRSVAWYASRVAVLSIGLGVPLGVAAGRWAWSRLAADVGMSLHPIVRIGMPVLAAAVALLCANVVAAVPGGRARRDDLVESLRDE